MNKIDYSSGSRICSSEVLPTKSQSSLLRKCEGKMEVDWSSISQSEAKTQALKGIIPEENGTFHLKVRHPVSSVVDDLLTCQQEIHSSNLGQCLPPFCSLIVERLSLMDYWSMIALIKVESLDE